MPLAAACGCVSQRAQEGFHHGGAAALHIGRTQTDHPVAVFLKSVVFQVMSGHGIQMADKRHMDIAVCRHHHQIVPVLIDFLAHHGKPVTFQIAVEVVHQLLFLAGRAVDVDETAQ